jgi:RimJ/RimL family protein N-acetyltransferase
MILKIASLLLKVSTYIPMHGAMADPFVIVKRSERKQGLGEFTLRKATDFATYLGYMGMYVDTFSSNEAILRIIEKIGGFVQCSNVA